MGYRPQPNQRKHKRLITDALSEAELLEISLSQLQEAAKNNETKSYIRQAQIRALTVEKYLNKMMDIVRREEDDEEEPERTPERTTG